MRNHLCFISILAVAAAFRLYNLSHGVSFHPDERHIIMVAEGLKWSDMNPHSFAYGSLPFYLLWAIAGVPAGIGEWLAESGLERIGQALASLDNYDGLFLVGRAISAMFGVLAVFLTFRLALKVFADRGLALLSAAFLGFNVLHLQLSRFYAFDGVLTTLNLAALVGMVAITKGGGMRVFLFTAFMIGASVATKISSLSLGIPVVVALLVNRWRRQEHGLPRFFSADMDAHGPAESPRSSPVLDKKFVISCLILVLGTATVFLCAEPYAILDFKTFLVHTKEQIGMVKGDWRPPYTIQYEGTAPYLYPMLQAYKYTLGPPLALACFGGLILGIYRQFKRPNGEELILLSWIVSVFLVIGSYKVKYPRYFLPLYPILMIYAAHFLWWLKERLSTFRKPFVKWLPAAIVLGWCAIYAFSFVRIYRYDHVYQLASEWIYKNIPSGSKLLGVDWDDKLPLHLPGFDARQYKYEGQEWELPMYAPDTPEKLDEVLKKLERADYIVFPTARHPGSIPRIPAEMPDSTNFYRLLFADKLGYKLIQTVKVRPGIGPLEFNDDLADESFSVYDHPKVSIFKNVERLPTAEMHARILEPDNYGALIDYQEILLKDADTSQVAIPEKSSIIFQVLVWLLILEILSFVALPWISVALPHARDGGLALAKCLGILLLSIAIWISNFFGLLSITAQNCWLLIFTMAFITFFVFKSRLPSSWHFKNFRGEALFTQGVWYLGLLVFLLLCAFHPEIFWGEKPMDFTFLNYLIRMEELPPQDPWAAGNVMNYYYFGTFIFAILHKVSGVDPAVGYNLALATVGALFLVTAYGVVRRLLRNCWAGLLGASAITFFSNSEVLNLAVIRGNEINFDRVFWDSSRLFTTPGFAEYPIWSFLFADLHAHVIALPVTICVIGLGIKLLERTHKFFSFGTVVHRVLFALTLGSLFAINTWDFLTYSAVTGLILIYRPFPTLPKKIRFKALLRFLLKFVRDALSLFIMVAIVISPFLMLMKSGTKAHFGWVNREEFNSLAQILRHVGHWVLWIAAGVLLLAWRRFRVRGARMVTVPIASDFSSEFVLTFKRRRLWSHALIVFALLVGSIPLGLGVGASLAGLTGIPWSILALATSLLIFCTLGCFDRRSKLGLRTIGVTATSGILLISITEVAFLMDRMNTIFKFYQSIWSLLGIAAVGVSPYILVGLGKVRGKKRMITYPLLFALFSALLIAGAGGVLNICIMTTFKRISGPRPTLDGTAYLKKSEPEEAALIEWMNRHISGTPTQIEAQGTSYSNFTRIAMHTGIPTVLGWDYHVTQRGTPHDEVERRRRDVKMFYSTTNEELARQLAEHYRIKLVVIGKLERATYPPQGLKKFENNERYKLLFKRGEAALYGVVQ